MRKKNIFIIFQILIKLILVIAITICFYGVFKLTFRNKDVSTNELFKALPENSMDVIVLGSSQAQYSFSPALFYKDTGLYSYNLGTQCQQPEVSYQMLKEAFKTQHPKLVILEVFTFLPLRAICKEDSCYVVAAYQMTGQERLDTLAYIDQKTAEQYYSDFSSLHNNWRKYYKAEIIDRIKTTFDKSDNKKFNDEYFGYVYMDGYREEEIGNYWFPSICDERDDSELETIHLEALNNIYELCKENNAELMLYKTPMDSMDVENYSYLMKVWEWANVHEVAYVDFLSNAAQHNLRINVESDSFHSNVAGAGIITNALSRKIGSCEFSHVEFDELSEYYLQGEDSILYAFTEYENNILSVLPLFKNFDGYAVIRYNSSGTINEYLYNYLSGIGIGDFDPNSSFVALIKDNKLIELADEYIECEVHGLNLLVSNDKVYYDGKLISTNEPSDFIFIRDDLPYYIAKGFDNSKIK